MTVEAPERVEERLREAGIRVTRRAIDRHAAAHDASHYLLVPELVVTPKDAAQVGEVLRVASETGRPVTFRSGGTSLSGQSVSGSLLVDTRSSFRRIAVEQSGERVRVQPGATVRATNLRLAPSARRLGPDPASEIACTIGGVVANNSSGMACGVERNTYRTLESMTVVLPSGTVVDTAAPDAAARLRDREPALHDGLLALRDELRASPEGAETVRRQFAIKNTMGYGLNALLDHDDPAEILARLVIGSEGTLAFVAETVFRTVKVLPAVATGLLVLPTLAEATAALPALVAAGFATIELMDAASLLVAQGGSSAPASIADLQVGTAAALLVELHAEDEAALAEAVLRTAPLLAALPLVRPAALTRDAGERAALWTVRKGLHTLVAGARPAGTTALLEDVAVPVDRLLEVCLGLQRLFALHGYEGSVIFGHAKDGNVHFLLNERFDDPEHVARYERFTADMVDLVLGQGGTLKAEHGTGRIMAPFVERQYGPFLTGLMRRVKALFDPQGILNPGVVLTDDPRSWLADLKTVPPVEAEVDRCVECGYCEPTCPSRDLTLTPRQRIVLRRDIAQAESTGDAALAAELRDDYRYEGVETCAVDGLCAVACPVDIDTGQLVRRLRAESGGGPERAVWNAAAKAWGPVTRAAGVGMTVAAHLPPVLPALATRTARSVLGADSVPGWTPDLPGGGPARPTRGAPVASADAVLFAACVGTMFGPSEGGAGATRALLTLAERAGVSLAVPEGLSGLCCGTPWKSKGHREGYRLMRDRVVAAVTAATDGGRLPVVCDASSCTEGLVLALADRGFDVQDATTFVRRTILPRLTVTQPLDSLVLHPTCSTTHLGATGDLVAIGQAIAEVADVPVDWGCCGYAGDRGMLHPELTAAATRDEAATVALRDYGAHASSNRTCELGMTAATGRPYRHVVELLEEATRPA